MLKIFVTNKEVFSIIESKDQVGQPVPLLQELKLKTSIPKAESLMDFFRELRVMISN
jgi:hypothetical protein